MLFVCDVLKKTHWPLRADSPEGEEKNSQEQEQGREQQRDEDAAEGSVRKPAAEPELTRSLSSAST
jgi:serine/threonine kinase 38